MLICFSACGSGSQTSSSGLPAPGGYLVYVRDREGSVLGAIDDRGQKVGASVDDAFGLRLTSTGVIVPHEFLDQDLDEETGYYHFQNRYYDPATAQWISPDPQLLENLDCSARVQGCNPYSFAGNRPLEWTDSDGRWISVIHDPDGTPHILISVAFIGPAAAAAQRLFIASLAHPLSAIRVTAITEVFRARNEAPASWTVVDTDRSLKTSQTLISKSYVTIGGDVLNNPPREGEWVVKHELWHVLGNPSEGYTNIGGHSVSNPGMENDIRGNFWDRTEMSLGADGVKLIETPPETVNQGLIFSHDFSHELGPFSTFTEGHY